LARTDFLLSLSLSLSLSVFLFSRTFSLTVVSLAGGGRFQSSLLPVFFFVFLALKGLREVFGSSLVVPVEARVS